MNTPTPTPRTDAATYPADCLGKTLVTNRDCSRELERELTALIAEREQLRAEVERFKGWLSEPQALHSHCLRTLNDAQIAHLFGERMTAIVNRAERVEAELAELHDSFAGNVHTRCNELRDELAAEREKAERYRLATLKLDAELATERARLDAGTILLACDGVRVWHCGVDLRAAIDAGIKEDAK
jgi:chromosome segregation ATPase